MPIKKWSGWLLIVISLGSKDTKIDWEISTKDNITQIKMTHIGLVPEIECYDNCVKGWTQYVDGSLFKLLTEGKGLPN